MRAWLSVAFIFGLSACATSGTDYDAALAKRLGADEYGMKSYVFVALKTGPARIDDEARRRELFAGHFANMGRLAEAGTLVLAGPYDDPDGVYRGLFILNVASLAQAGEIVQTDPAVAAGVFEAEMFGWYGSAALMQIPELHRRIQKTKVE